MIPRPRRKKFEGHIHVYPIDATLTPEEAWDEICIMGFRATDTGSEIWGVMKCDGEECRNIQHAEEDSLREVRQN